MITRVPGFWVGHASDFKNVTGCTVVLCPPGTVGSVDIRGSAAGTRQLDALLGFHMVNEVHAVCISGGSAFGLDAAGGVMEFLEEQGRGFDVTITRVPIVPTAVIYDLSVGNCRARPDKAMGYAACQAARPEAQGDGSLGAGTGATVGKLLGIHQATKGGLGTSFLEGPDGLRVGALAVVNAFGDVVDPQTGEILAGARTAPESREFADSIRLLRQGVVRRQLRGTPTPPSAWWPPTPASPGKRPKRSPRWATTAWPAASARCTPCSTATPSSSWPNPRSPRTCTSSACWRRPPWNRPSSRP